jgi:nucleoside-diphosphate-sugar epimerase
VLGIRTERFGCHHRPASHDRGAGSAWNLSDPLRVDLPREKHSGARDGKNIYQFVHADDLAEACIQASIVTGADAFNCGTDRFRTMREVLEHLCRHAGTGSQVKSLPMWPIVAATNLSSRMGISPLGADYLFSRVGVVC